MNKNIRLLFLAGRSNFYTFPSNRIDEQREVKVDGYETTLVDKINEQDLLAEFNKNGEYRTEVQTYFDNLFKEVFKKYGYIATYDYYSFIYDGHCWNEVATKYSGNQDEKPKLTVLGFKKWWDVLPSIKLDKDTDYFVFIDNTLCHLAEKHRFDSPKQVFDDIIKALTSKENSSNIRKVILFHDYMLDTLQEDVKFYKIKYPYLPISRRTFPITDIYIYSDYVSGIFGCCAKEKQEFDKKESWNTVMSANTYTNTANADKTKN